MKCHWNQIWTVEINSEPSFAASSSPLSWATITRPPLPRQHLPAHSILGRIKKRGKRQLRKTTYVNNSLYWNNWIPYMKQVFQTDMRLRTCEKYQPNVMRVLTRQAWAGSIHHQNIMTQNKKWLTNINILPTDNKAPMIGDKLDEKHIFLDNVQIIPQSVEYMGK